MTAFRRRTAAGLLRLLGLLAVATATACSTAETEPEPAPVAGGSTPTGEAHQTGGAGEWRTEWWLDVAVDVPASWGWGGAPLRDGTACGAVATVAADGTRLRREDPDLGYVGRPVAQTDVCTSYPDDARFGEPTAPYVWLGVELDPGTVELADGWVRETVRVQDTTVTVTAADEALRRRVLDSARPADGEGCAPELASVPEPVAESTVEGRGELRSAYACAYRRVDGVGPLQLAHGAELGAAALERLAAAVSQAPPLERRCKSTDEVVVVEGTFLDPYTPDPELWLRERTVLDLTCGTVAAAGDPFASEPPGRHRITEATVLPWVGGGAGAVLVGPPVRWSYDHFIGVQG